MIQLNEQSGWSKLKSGEAELVTVPKSTTQQTNDISPKQTTNDRDNDALNKIDLKTYDPDYQTIKKDTGKKDTGKIDTDKKDTAVDLGPNIDNPVNRIGKLVRAQRAINDWINPDLIRDLQIAVRNAKIGDVEITFAKTDHSYYVDGTKTVSRHMNGTGVDISALGGKDGKNFYTYVGNGKIFTILGNILVRELKKLGYRRNEGGNPKAYVWQSKGHSNHVHVSNTSQKRDPKDIIVVDALTETQFKYHATIRKAFNDMYNVITLNPSNYFSTYRDYLSADDTKEASNFLKVGFNAGWDIYFKAFYDKAHPNDQKNIDTLRNVIKTVRAWIEQGKTGSLPVTFKSYNKMTLEWNNMPYKFKWDFM